jgi:hypothetical protein
MAITDLMVSLGQALAPALKVAGDWIKKAAVSVGE